VVYLEVKAKIVKHSNNHILPIILLVLFTLCSASVLGLTSSDIVGIGMSPPPPADDACELHMAFRYIEPGTVDLNNLIIDDAFVAGSAPVFDFLKRIDAISKATGETRSLTVYGYSSYEGSASVNKDLAQKRANVLARAMEDSIQINKYKGVSSIGVGSIQGKSVMFYDLTAKEKKAIDDFYRTRSTQAERTQIFANVPALMENRRAVIVWGGGSPSVVSFSGGSFILVQNGCPEPKPEKPVCGDGKADSSKECDDSAGMDCSAKGPNLKCSDCKCIPADVLTPANCGNNKIEEGEQCDGTSDTACPGKCQGCKCFKNPFPWWYLLPLLLLIPFIYRMRKSRGEKRKRDEGLKDNVGTICIFLARLIKKKAEVIEAIRALEERISLLDVTAKKDLAEYIKKFRDVAYLRDQRSPESLMLGKAGKGIREIFEMYLELIGLLLELESLEATLLNFISDLKDGCREIFEDKVNHRSATLEKMNILISEEEARLLDDTILKKLTDQATKINEEIRKIETTVEDHIREMGLGISGIVSFFGHDKWKKKWIEEYGEGGEEAFKKIWWAKHDLKFRAPLYLREEGSRTLFQRRTGIHKIFGRWKDKDGNNKDGNKQTVISTAPDSPEEKEWKERAKKLYSMDISTRSAYVKNIGADITENIGRDMHILSDLFKIVKIGNEKEIQKLAVHKDEDLIGKSPDDLKAKGFRYGGSLQDEIDSLESLMKMICYGFAVKIEYPVDRKVKKRDLDKLLAEKTNFTAKIVGGAPNFKYVWYWGQYEWDSTKKTSDQDTRIIRLSGSEAIEYSMSDKRILKYDYGFMGLKKKTSRDDVCVAFKEPYISTDNKCTLHVLVIDANGKVAHDHVTIQLEGIEPKDVCVLSGRVVKSDDIHYGVEGAEVWVKHAETKGGELVEYMEGGKIVKVTSGHDGKFVIKGKFKYDVRLFAEKGDSKGNSLISDLGRPVNASGEHVPFDCPPGRYDIVIPMIFMHVPALPSLDYPDAIDDEIIKNIAKLQDITDAKINVQGSQGVKNYAAEQLKNMRKEIEDHLDRINKSKGRVKIEDTKSAPLGLDDYSKNRFFGYYNPNMQKLTIVSIEKFVFGSERELPINSAQKVFKTKGVSEDYFIRALYGGNIVAIKMVVDIIEEKKKLIKDYIISLKEFEDKLAKAADTAAKDNDEELFNLYEKMIHCFTNIREFYDKHGTLKSLDTIEAALKAMTEFNKKMVTITDKNYRDALNITNDADMVKYSSSLGDRMSCRDDTVDRMLCELYRWKHSTEQTWEQEEKNLDDAFNKVIAEIKENIALLVDELNTPTKVMKENYDTFSRDIQEFKALKERRNKEAKEGKRLAA